jgi:hypothetical protein
MDEPDSEKRRRIAPNQIEGVLDSNDNDEGNVAGSRSINEEENKQNEAQKSLIKSLIRTKAQE